MFSLHQGSIPLEIGLLSNLTHLRLSYNEFVGNGVNLLDLQHLQLVHLHGNRLNGDIQLNFKLLDRSATTVLISDCGNPSDFSPSIKCKNCTIMCCKSFFALLSLITAYAFIITPNLTFFTCLLGNNEASCLPILSEFPLSDITESLFLVLQFIACFIGASSVLALGLIVYEIHRNRHISVTRSITNLDLKYSLDKIGDGSVYKFFLGKRVLGWLIAISTIGAQIWMLSIFVEGSKRDTSDGKVDMSYTWKCTRDKDECFDTNDLDWRGWIAFAILMGSHLLTDAINGMKMIKHSTKQRHGRNARIRLFVGGTLLTFVTVFTTYVSTLYNQVIATSKLFLSN